MLALGLVLIGLSPRLPVWVGVAGVVAAAGHLVAATAVLFGADLPSTGGDPTAWPSPVVAASKLVLWATMIGWLLAVWRRPSAVDADAGQRLP